MADISIPTGLYQAVSLQLDINSANCNFGCSTNALNLRYFVSAYRTAGVQDDTDNGSVSGPISDYVRLVKLSTGIYELQIRQIADWKHMAVRIQELSKQAAIITYNATLPAGSSGTIYMPTLVHTDYATNLSV